MEDLDNQKDIPYYWIGQLKTLRMSIICKLRLEFHLSAFEISFFKSRTWQADRRSHTGKWNAHKQLVSNIL